MAENLGCLRHRREQNDGACGFGVNMLDLAQRSRLLWGQQEDGAGEGDAATGPHRPLGGWQPLLGSSQVLPPGHVGSTLAGVCCMREQDYRLLCEISRLWGAGFKFTDISDFAERTETAPGLPLGPRFAMPGLRPAWARDVVI